MDQKRTWSRLLPADEFGEGAGRFAEFYEWQTRRWSTLADARSSLQDSRVRLIEVDGGMVKVQWNPARTTSATAKVDSESIRARSCFLCPENQPEQEWGLPVGHDLVALANPAPILGCHLVLAHRDHRVQVVAPVVSSLIAIPELSRGTLTTLYNGRECGASAPDHLHLQVVAAGESPFERALARPSTSRLPTVEIVSGQSLRIWSERWAGRTAVIVHGARQQVEQATQTVVASWTELVADSLEGPLNAVACLLHGDPCVAIFPRGAHRPECYHQGRLLISPGALDMAGFFVTIRSTDFDRVDASTVEEIFSETSISADMTRRLVRLLRGRVGND